MNCPNCGAVVKEGRFCNYCGAKLPDDTKRVEVNINKRIEDVAEMKRADYETDESKLKQIQMKRELRGRTTRRWSCLIGLGLCIIFFVIAFGFDGKGMAGNGVNVLLGFISVLGGIPLLIYIIVLLIRGKF